MKFLRLAVKIFQLSLLRVGAGWMFALLTFNFNRTAIADLGALAIVVATLIGLHHFLSPLQVFWGRMADRYPLFGYRRTPYILGSSLVASTVFLFLPSIAVGLGAGSPSTTILAFGLIAIFGVSMAANGSSSNALMAEVTTDKERGGVVATVWAMMLISLIATSIVAAVIMPDYDPQKMQQLYNLTPFVVLISTALGVLGRERRITPAEHAALLARQPSDEGGFLATARVATRLVRTNVHVRMFALFVLLGILGIFLQDAILEPFGAEVFGMSQAETARFQQFWGGGAVIGMLGIGVLSGFLPVAKKTIATIGGLGIACGLGLITLAAALHQPTTVMPGLVLMGLGIGLFNVGALSMMMEMTVEGQTGLYMGIWGMSQGLGNGFANVLSGALHTGLIETGLLTPALGYTLIFGCEALLMVVAVGILRGISVQEFKGLSRSDISKTMALDTAG